MSTKIQATRFSVLILLTLLMSFIVISNLMANESHEHLESTSALLTSNRDKLSICIDTDKSVKDRVDIVHTANKVKRLIKTEIPNLQYWPETDYGKYNIKVTRNCPNEPYLLKSQARHPILATNDPQNTSPIPIVEHPSPHRLHIYVVSQETMGKMFEGNEQLHYSPEEILCTLHDSAEHCSEVTTALYMTPENLISDEYLVTEIGKGLGLIEVPEFNLSSESESHHNH